jgi:hypothetical protein
MEREALWILVVETKYKSMWDGWCSNAVYGSYGVEAWKNIRRRWGNFSIFVRFEMGDGSKIRC